MQNSTRSFTTNMSKVPRDLGRLSKAERTAVKELGDSDMIARMDKGDRYEQSGDYVNEMLYHREIQEQLRTNHGIYCRDKASREAYAYNSCGIHNPGYIQYYSSLGYGFNDIFGWNPNTFHYDKLLGQQYIDDPNTVQYHLQSRANNAYMGNTQTAYQNAYQNTYQNAYPNNYPQYAFPVYHVYY